MDKREWLARQLEQSGATELMLRWPRRARMLHVLTFHRVATDAGELDDGVVDATPEGFDRAMASVRRYFDPISVAELAAYFQGAPLPARPVMVTFDDGYGTCHDAVLPILRRHGVHAVFFIATRYVTERRLFWWDRIAYLVKRSPRHRIALAPGDAWALETPAQRRAAIDALAHLVKTAPGLDLERFLAELAAATGVPWSDAIERRLADATVMTWEQVRRLRAAGMDVQSHTRNHRVLETLPAAALDDELAGARTELARELGEAPRALSYPVGHTLANHPAIVEAVRRAGYELGFTNNTGAQPLRRDADPYDVRRIGGDRSSALLRATLALPALFA